MTNELIEHLPAKESRLERTLSAEVRAECPFSIAQEYATDYLKLAGYDGNEGQIYIPLRVLGISLHRRVRLTFSIHPDDHELGRFHDEIGIRWMANSALLPDFHGEIRFRIDCGGTRIAIDGLYSAPLGTIGRLFDKLIGMHIAETSIKDLALRIGAYLEARQREWRARVGSGLVTFTTRDAG